MSYRHFPASLYQSMPWKNGGGSTSEIFRYPENQETWQWRISIAEVASDGAFSLFPGCQRSSGISSVPGFGVDLDDLQPVLRCEFPEADELLCRRSMIACRHPNVGRGRSWLSGRGEWHWFRSVHPDSIWAPPVSVDGRCGTIWTA